MTPYQVPPAYVVVQPDLQAGLRSLMISIPKLRFSRRHLLSQAGPIKPDRQVSPKLAPLIPVPIPTGELVNVIADRQEFDVRTQIFTATGNVTVKYLNSELRGETVTLNLITKDATATGKVELKRGEQLVRGERLVYNYGTVKGSLFEARGFLNLDTLTSSQVTRLPADLRSRSSVINVFGEAVPAARDRDISRLGFRADQINLDGDNWTAENLRVTNDPFDPPELELRTPKASLTKISPSQDRLEAESPTLVFDQGLTLPIPINSIVLDRFERSLPIRLGFDRRDGGGFFYQQNFDAHTQSDINFQISPQLFLQRAFEGSFFDANILGVAARLDAALPDNQFFTGRATLSGLNLGNVENQLRAHLQYSRPVLDNHILVAQYAFRDRLFNGSLGFQDVRNSLGVNLFSPNYVIGDTQINFSYQIGAQFIGADRDRGEGQPIEVASLIRTQGAVALSRAFPLWRGQVLAAEKESGLKYSPEPIIPGIDAFVGLNANSALYSSGDSQSFVSGTVGVVGIFGNFSQPFFDYTRINLSYTQGFVGGRSPFLFDRIADPKILTFGLVQQIYGPVRFGIEQSWNPDSGRIVDSNYSLQYDRRTYAIVIRYNPTREVGELVLRISDFNWGDRNSEITTVTGGIADQ